MLQAERSLQREVITRLKALRANGTLKAVCIGSPNGVYFPARTPAERALVARVVHQLKLNGGLTPGAPDLTFLWRDGSGCVELKRPQVKRLFDTQTRGQLSGDQRVFRDECTDLQVRYVVCESWDDVRDTLIAWGLLPVAYTDPERRIGRAA